MSDKSFISKDAVLPYTAIDENLTNGVVDISSIDYTPSEPCTGFIVIDTGDIEFHLKGNTTGKNIVIPNVPAFTEFRGFIVDKFFAAGSSSTSILPLF